MAQTIRAVFNVHTFAVLASGRHYLWIIQELINSNGSVFVFTFSFEAMPVAVTVAFLGCDSNIGTTLKGKLSQTNTFVT